MDETVNNNQFNDDFDRLIKGEFPEANNVPPEDYKDTLNFAKRMLESRVEPSPAFKDNMRRRLLSKMVEREMETERKKAHIKDFRDTIISWMPRSPAWRTVTATIAVFVLALVVVWRIGLFTATENPPIVGSPPPSTTTPQGPVTVTAVTLQETYMTGEIINVKFIFSNQSEEALTLPTFPPKLIIAAANLKPYKITTGGGPKTLEPGEVIEYTVTWDQIDDEGQQVPPGTYVINMLDIELENGKGTITLPESPSIIITSP